MVVKVSVYLPGIFVVLASEGQPDTVGTSQQKLASPWDSFEVLLDQKPEKEALEKMEMGILDPTQTVLLVLPFVIHSEQKETAP